MMTEQPIIIDHRELPNLIPHRYPFLLIDRVEDVYLGDRATGIKNLSLNEWFFPGHFPAHPIFPGVLIIEALAQTAAALVVKTLQAEGKCPQDQIVYFMSVEKAKFRKPVYPGDILKLKVQKERARGLIWRFKGEAFVDDQLTDEAVFTAQIVSSK